MEFITTYALPYAFPVIKLILGTTALEKAYVNFAAAIPTDFASSRDVPKPVTLVKVSTGI